MKTERIAQNNGKCTTDYVRHRKDYLLPGETDFSADLNESVKIVEARIELTCEKLRESGKD